MRMLESSTFDFSILEEVIATGDSRAMARGARIIKLFLAESANRLTEAAQCLEGRDFEGLVFSAHRLRGSCSYIGSAQMTALCRRLEEAGRDQLVGQAELCLADVTDSLQRARPELEALVIRFERASEASPSNANRLSAG